MYTSVWVVDVYYFRSFHTFRISTDKVASLFLFNYILHFHVGDEYSLQKELPVTQPGAFHTGWKTFHLSGITSCPSMATEK